jgi:hypothetical protein
MSQAGQLGSDSPAVHDLLHLLPSAGAALSAAAARACVHYHQHTGTGTAPDAHPLPLHPAGAPQQPAAVKQVAPQATSSANTLAAKLRKAPRSSALVADLSKSLRVKLPLVQHEPLPAGNLTVLPDMFMPFGARPLSEMFASVINTTALGLAAEGMGMVEGTGVMGIV